MPNRVVRQVADEAGEQIGVSQHPTCADPGEVDIHAVVGAQSTGHSEHDVVEVDGLATDLADDALVGSGDEQQVVGESLEPDGLVEDAGMGGQQVGLLADERGPPRARCGCA